MNDMEEEIDRIEKISYMKINNHYNSQIAYTIKQGYTCIVYDVLSIIKSVNRTFIHFPFSLYWHTIMVHCSQIITDQRGRQFTDKCILLQNILILWSGYQVFNRRMLWYCISFFCMHLSIISLCISRSQPLRSSHSGHIPSIFHLPITTSSSVFLYACPKPHLSHFVSLLPFSPFCSPPLLSLLILFSSTS